MHYLIKDIIESSLKSKIYAAIALAIYLSVGYYTWNYYPTTDFHLDALKYAM